MLIQNKTVLVAKTVLIAKTILIAVLSGQAGFDPGAYRTAIKSIM